MVSSWASEAQGISNLAIEQYYVTKVYRAVKLGKIEWGNEEERLATSGRLEVMWAKMRQLSAMDTRLQQESRVG